MPRHCFDDLIRLAFNGVFLDTDRQTGPEERLDVKRAIVLQLILLVLVTASVRYAFVRHYGIPGARDDAAIY